MTADEAIAVLEKFEPSEVDRDNAIRLYDVFERVRDLPNRHALIPAIFALMERLPGTVLGTPGPLVHELERMGGYEVQLRESVFRQPSFLSVWMVNRILNVENDKATRESWIHLLEIAAAHPRAPHSVRENAAAFIHRQRRIEES